MRIIGLMSGTSCDGLDLVCVDFDFSKTPMGYQMVASSFEPFSADWQQRLLHAHQLTGLELHHLDIAFGQWIGVQVRNFIAEYKLQQVTAIASHGHTIFHEPDKGLTLQIGNGAYIKQMANLPVICNFRIQDVANHGQGAPLVPVGDALLFPQYDACLNLGGFANISFEENGQRKAFDICPMNIVLNALAHPDPYDAGGALAALGTPIEQLIFELGEVSYYGKLWPKSLGREWVTENIWPIINSYKSHSREELLTSFSLHIVMQLHFAVQAVGAASVLITGGGAYNSFTVNHLKKRTSAKVIVPDDETIQFKEAIVFALLGALRLQNKTNVLGSVTGGCSDLSAGLIYH